LDVSGLGITDLTGIEAFTNITSLTCTDNSLISLNISVNTKLVNLYCSFNNITSITGLDQVPNLQRLACYVNKLATLDVKKNTVLTYLQCSGNQLPDLDISSNKALTELAVTGNNLQLLDIGANELLDLVGCANNKISQLDLSKNKLLSRLFCSNNLLEKLDVSANPITQLDCSQNQLTGLNAKNGNNTNLITFNSTANPTLTCIQVDDPVYMDSKWSAGKDAAGTFSINCTQCSINTWTSAANNGDWNNPNNWCSGAVPTSTTDAIIPAGNMPYPTLSADASVHNIVIESGATLSIGVHTLTLNGTVNEATAGSGGTISGSNESNLVSLNNGATYIYFTPGQNILKNLTLGYSAQLFVNSGDLEIAASPTPGVVTFAEYANFSCSNLIFKSGPNGTARLAELPVFSNGEAIVQIQGQQTVERYIPANPFRSWRLLSVPTFGNSQTIRQAWQEGDANPNPLDNNLPNFGTQIISTGNLATAQNAGFDDVAAHTSLLNYDGTVWKDATTTNTAIATKKGYFLYIQGERQQGVTGALNSTSATTLRTKGNLYKGAQTTDIIPANSFAVVGNIYASAVDFTKLTLNGAVDPVFYIWDAKKLSGNSLGVYQTFSATNNYASLISGGSFAVGDPNVVIQSGQAFFVKTSTAEGSVTFTENSKVSSSSTAGFRPATPTTALVKIDSRLYSSTTSNNTLADANVVVFSNSYSNMVDGNDAQKLGNLGENFGVIRSNKTLVIEGRQVIDKNDTIQFNMWNLQQQSYRLEFAAQNLANPLLIAELEDKYLHINTVLDLSVTSSVDFLVDADAASKATDRFRIVFTQSAPLQVSFISITANRSGNNVKVDWKVAAENGILNYEIERSANGRSFAKAGSVNASGIGVSNYNWIDADAVNSTLFYRIKSIGISGEVKYSAIVKIAAYNPKPGYSIAPNPVKRGETLLLSLQNGTVQKIEIISMTGHVVYSKQLKITGSIGITVPAALAAGEYLLKVVSESNSTIQKMVIW
jgi:hypothetical protein